MLALVSLINPITSYAETSRLIHTVLTETHTLKWWHFRNMVVFVCGNVRKGVEVVHQRSPLACVTLPSINMALTKPEVCQAEIFHCSPRGA